MAITNSFIQFPRKNIPLPEVTLNITPDGYILCNDVMEFEISVLYFDGNSMVPVTSGSASVIDGYTGEVIGPEQLVGGYLTIPNPGIYGYRQYYAQYLGVTGEFLPARSSTVEYYVEKSITSVSTAASNDVVYNLDAYIAFDLSTTSPYVNLSGSVEFRLYVDDDNYTSLDSASIIANQATCFIPANTLELGGTYYLSALYAGDGCVMPGFNGLGMDAFQINAIS